ncbi:MAG: lactate racemase domain-containing protein [Planctomycetota bacterium]|jgi:nickel-dependent lactate racemase
MKVPLHFGEGVVELEIPEENLAEILQPGQSKQAVIGADVIASAIKRGQSGLIEQISGCSVGVLLPDGTRDLPLEDILPLLLPLLRDAQTILFFICTGSHDPKTPSNSRIVSTIQAQTAATGIVKYEVIPHDCQTSSVSSAGATQQGTEVLYNTRLDEADVFIALSDVKHHYFAGYSNPIKNIVPGLCAFKTIEQNHSLTLDDRSRAGIHPRHPDENRRDNPLATDQLEAMLSIVCDRSVWSLTTISHSGVIQWAEFGMAAEVSSRAFQQADDWNMHTAGPVEYMIASPGGLPHDVDLYIAQRALELTTSVVCDGGQVLFLAACPDGIGSELTREHFENELMSPPEVTLCKTRKEYHLFEHKPYRFAKLIQRLDTLWIHTHMAPSVVQKIHAEPCADPQAVVSSWLAGKPDAKILIVDGANKLLLTAGT